MTDTPESRQSTYSYAETVQRLSNAIAGGGNTIFATIDQAEAARGAGLSLRPTTLILFGNPKGGTPLMAAYPLVALELPLKVIVWEADGAVWVAAPNMSSIASRYGVAGFDELIAKMDGALAAVTTSVAAP